jgi:histidinol-phosphate/aromatic aminotransferase/cobyric acid decarboxylase-like protein
MKYWSKGIESLKAYVPGEQPQTPGWIKLNTNENPYPPSARVLQAVAAFEQASGRSIPIQRVARRSGDVATCYASATRATELLGWQAAYGLDKMCADHWRWQHNNPDGY